MSVTPDGLLSESVLWRAKLVAASATFQAWVGASDAEEALDSVSLVMSDAASLTRPRAYVAVTGSESPIDEESDGPVYWEELEFGLVFEGHVAATAEAGEVAARLEEIDGLLTAAASAIALEEYALAGGKANSAGGLLRSLPEDGGEVMTDLNGATISFLNVIGGILDDMKTASGRTVMDETGMAYPRIRPSLVWGPRHVEEEVRRSWGYTGKGWGFAIGFQI